MSGKEEVMIVGVIIVNNKYLCVECYKQNNLILEFPKVRVKKDKRYKIILKNYFQSEFKVSIEVKEYITTIKSCDENLVTRNRYYFCEIQNNKNITENSNIKWLSAKELNDELFVQSDKQAVCFIKKEFDFLLKFYISAKQFEHAVLNSYERINGKIYNRPIPYIVNSVFACELYLKLILKIHKIKHDNCHKILSLLKKAELYDELRENKYFSCMPFDELETELLNIDNAFVDWRYSFESKKLLMVDQHFLDKLIIFLDNKSRTLFEKKFSSIIDNLKTDYFDKIDEIY